MTINTDHSTDTLVPSSGSMKIESHAPHIVSSGAVSLASATHLNKIVVLNSGASLTINKTNLTMGFSCCIFNNTGGDITPTISNFSSPAATAFRNTTNTKIKSLGFATIVVVSTDGGTTHFCVAGGDLAA